MNMNETWVETSVKLLYSESETYMIFAESEENAILFERGGKGGWSSIFEGTLQECKTAAK